jgi:hypothetical protein
VAEVRGHDEDIGGVGEVGCKKGAVFRLGLCISVADHDGDKRDGGWRGLKGDATSTCGCQSVSDDMRAEMVLQ